jgi:uncharacterized protein YeaO (DUF488 family)
VSIRIKRVYDAAAPGDGCRILVDRVWPRGLTKEAARADRWMKELAPSAALRTWFGHDPDKWPEFRRRYFTELERQGEAIEALRAETRKGTVTLLYGARDAQHNNALALKQYLEAAP